MSPVAPPRRKQLGEVLRELVAGGESLRLLVGEVVSSADSKHVTVSIAGTDVEVPKLSSYTAPVTGEACYLLTSSGGNGLAIALGAVR